MHFLYSINVIVFCGVFQRGIVIENAKGWDGECKNELSETENPDLTASLLHAGETHPITVHATWLPARLHPPLNIPEQETLSKINMDCLIHKIQLVVLLWVTHSPGCQFHSGRHSGPGITGSNSKASFIHIASLEKKHAMRHFQLKLLSVLLNKLTFPPPPHKNKLIIKWHCICRWGVSGN